LCILFSFQQKKSTTAYHQNFYQNINVFEQSQIELIDIINQSDLLIDSNISTIKEKIFDNRVNMKAIDFWLRYIEPTLYKKINGPLPVEWETEVFEKYEKPYRREGDGFT
jgi:cytochrome c peroxidase